MIFSYKMFDFFILEKFLNLMIDLMDYNCLHKINQNIKKRNFKNFTALSKNSIFMNSALI